MMNVKSCWLSGFTWIVRIVIGTVFVLSGFFKSVDPWGTLYKFNDYLGALSFEIWPNLVLVGAFGLSCIEFLVGIFLIFGCFRRSSSIAAMLIMVFMLPLTLWIAISDPVKDCGCFGEAFILSNWATFWKNVLLFAGTLWLLKFNARIHWLITPALQWLAFVASAFFILTIEFYGFSYQPLLDFRPYKIGKQLIDEHLTDLSQPGFIFIYERDGERLEVNEDENLPDEEDGWKFIDRREIYPDEEVIAANEDGGRNIRIWDNGGRDDVTEEVIEEDGKEMIIMMPDVKEVSPATTWKLNSLYEWSEKNGVDMIAVVSGSPTEIDAWKDISMASYDIYTADDTQIKEVVRGNPGVVYLENGTIVWKSTLRALNIDDFMSTDISGDAGSFGFDNIRTLLNCLYIYLIVMILLSFLSFVPYLKKYYFISERKSHSDKKGVSSEK